MSNNKSDKRSDIDRGENTTLMEPLLISENSRHWSGLMDLAVELAAKSAGFKRSLPAAMQDSLAYMVRAMSCYYSNLIEGHNTHPIAIEQALQEDYSKGIKKRNLQLEAKAHIAVQEWIDNGGIWSISRGLARNVEEYKQYLANCDLSRRNDLDGRGNLSEEAIVEFTRFFLEACLDQVNFMEKLMQPEQLRTRILLWAKEECEMGKLPPQAVQLLEAILYRGEISRGDMAAVLNVSDRHARRLAAPLFKKGVLTSDTPKSAIRLGFPAALAYRFMPGLFPPS